MIKFNITILNQLLCNLESFKIIIEFLQHKEVNDKRRCRLTGNLRTNK